MQIATAPKPPGNDAYVVTASDYGCPAARMPVRVLPTPCRGRPVPPPRSQSLDEQGPLRTLLEESVRSRPREAFLEARVLLEALLSNPPVVHGAGVEPPSGCEVEGYRPTISLQEGIPPTDFQYQVQTLEALVPSLVRTPVDAEPDWLDTDLRALCSDKAVPRSLRHVFAQIPTWYAETQAGPIWQLDIYTDGSADAQTTDAGILQPAAWAFSVWAHVGPNQYLLGWSAHTTVPPDTPFFLGEHMDDCLESEHLALTWACVWALEYGSRYQVPIMFYYDAIAAGGGAFGCTKLAGPKKCDSGISLVAFLSVLRQTLVSRARVGHAHVKGHSGVLQNELCDQLAKRARKFPEDFLDRCLPLWPAQWRSHSLAAWGWLAHQHLPGLPSLSAFQAEACRLQTQPEVVQPPTQGIKEVTEREAEVQLSLTFVTFNVLSLFAEDAPKGRPKRLASLGMMIAGKRDIMKQQFRKENVWAIGLQETRLPLNVVLPDPDFVMYNSAATAEGSYGCSLWVNLQQPYGHRANKPLFFRPDYAVVTDLSPRHLVVQVDAPHMRLTILVAHAPKPTGQTPCPAQAFWNMCRQALQKRPESSEIVILMDANSHVGSIPTEALGPHDEETENPAGELCHSFLLDIGCCLPATWSDFHTGESWTWIGPGADAAKHRLDYIAVPISWKRFGMKSWVWEQFEALQARQDHRPACLSAVFARLQPAVKYVDSRRRACRPSRDSSPRQRQKFFETLASASGVHWTVSIDTHCEVVTSGLVKAGQASCQPTTHVPKQPYLTDHTLGLVKQRTAVRQYLKQEEGENGRRLKMICFAAFVLHLRHAGFTSSALASASSWLEQIDRSVARALDLLRSLTTAVRAAVRRDRVQYLQGLVDNISLQDRKNPKALYQAVRKAFPTAKAARRSTFQPLPAVELADGTLAPTVLDRQDRWTEFFAEQEARKGHRQ